MKTKKYTHTASGATLGSLYGLMIGMVFLEGNIAAGLAFGALLGLAVGSIADHTGVLPLGTLTGLAEGSLVGTLLGLLVGLAHGAYTASGGQAHFVKLLGQPFEHSYIGLGLLVGAALGMVVGAVKETRSLRSGYSTGD